MGTRVQTTNGMVEGTSADGVSTWRGLPYAAAPLGELRFRPPAPAPVWEGVRDATRNGPVSWQPESSGEIEPLPADAVMSEDCLHLTVWAPDDARIGSLPVFVWIHGGAFITNSGTGPWTDGGVLARAEEIVVVSIDYRLGALGGLSLEEAGAPGGNLVLDPIAALTWVRENIAAFGGDPERVTVGGQSAGAMIVAALLVSPLAAGLLHGAVVQSGHGSATRSLEEAERMRGLLLRALGTDDGARVLHQLQALEPERLLEAQGRLWEEEGAPPFQVVEDGRVIGGRPLDEVRAGRWNTVPVLIGTTTDEDDLFTAMGWSRLDDRPLEQRIDDRLSVRDASEAEALAALYREAAGREDRAWSMFATDHAWRQPNREFASALAASSPVFRYEFAYSSPARGGAFRASHSMELPFVFGTLDVAGVDAFTGSDEQAPSRRSISSQCMRAWGSFIRDGRPSADGLPAWPQYDSDELLMRIDAECEVLRDPHADRLDRLRSTAVEDASDD